MKAMELIETYNISLCERLEWGKGLVPDGRIKVGSLAKAQKDGAIDMIKTKKPEIMSVLLARRDARIQAEAERQARIDAIPGLAEIRAAKEEIEEWDRKFAATFAGPNACGGLGMGPRPAHDIPAMLAKYPRAAAYLKAEAWARGAHYAKVAAGKAALEKIIQGEDFAAALAEMEAAWAAHCDEHAWD